jgi:hypothetical protein
VSLTLKQQIAADVAPVFLNIEEHGDTLTLYPAGDLDAGIAVAAVVDWGDRVYRSVPTDKDHDRGEGQLVHGALYVASSVSLTYADRWLIDGRIYDCEAKPLAQDGGLQKVRIILRESVRTMPPHVTRRGR